MFLKAFVLASVVVLFGTIADNAFAFDDFNGRIESRPENGLGALVIGGRTIYATERTKLDEHDRPLEVGACVEVDIFQGWVTEIERDADWRCRD